MRVSVVVPAYNEAANLGPLYERLLPVLEGLTESAELVIVDDGSVDRTAEVARALDGDRLPVRVISLARNFGHQTALTAGIDLSTGDAVVLMDADLQHPPETIAAMVKRWREGNEVVYGVRSDVDAESLFKRHSANAFYALLDRVARVNVPLNAADFRLLDRRVVDALGHMREDDRYLRGMIAWLGFRQAEVEFDRPERHAGQSKYTFGRMLRLAMNGMLGFSTRPLHLATSVGFVFSGLALIAGIFGVSQRLLGADLVPGWASILVLVAFIGGIQLLVLGVLGEYLGRVHSEVKQRPLYVVRELSGFPESPRAPDRVVLPPAIARSFEAQGEHVELRAR